MDRKPDWPGLFLFTALLFGAAIRFWPAISNGFPLNDGGMFYSMARDLQANHYVLPQFTTYNSSEIPFAYPPLGFYVAASLSGLLPVSAVSIFLWLPALVNTLSILVFYKFAEEVLLTRTSAALAVLIYALSPRAFLWQVMGGGVTRAFGILFLLLMTWQAVALFKNYSHKKLALTVLFGAGAVLSHPQTALHAALAGGLIFAFYGRNKRGLVSALLTGLGVCLLTAPWWGLALARYGLDPFLSAGQTSQRTLESYLAIIKIEGLGDYLFLPTLLLAFIGIWVTFKQREYFLCTWAVFAYLVDPRGGEGIALLSLSMLAGIGLYKLCAWMSRPGDVQAAEPFAGRRAQLLIAGLVAYFVLVAGVSDLQLLNTSLKPADLATIDWVQANVSGHKTFLLATGREFSMSDPLQEWFPALTGQHSATTMQGLEWTLGQRFFPWYDQLIAFQHCADVQCVSDWSGRNNIHYDYLVVMIPGANDRDELANSLRSLAISARTSALHLLVYESEDAQVFELGK